MNKTFKKVAQRTGLGILLASLVTTSSLVGMSYKSSNFSERIRDKQHLERIIEEEKENLGIGRLKINGRIATQSEIDFETGSSIAEGYSEKNSDGTYSIVLAGDAIDTRDGIRHELYHIARGCQELTSGGSNSILKKALINTLGEKGRKIYVNKVNPVEQFLNYQFIEEPITVLYAATGIKIGSLPLARTEELK